MIRQAERIKHGGQAAAGLRDEKAVMHANNILDDIPAELPEELFTTILRADYVWV